jgi:hypothetical protein
VDEEDVADDEDFSRVSSSGRPGVRKRVSSFEGTRRSYAIGYLLLVIGYLKTFVSASDRNQTQRYPRDWNPVGAQPPNKRELAEGRGEATLGPEQDCRRGDAGKAEERVPAFQHRSEDRNHRARR